MILTVLVTIALTVLVMVIAQNFSTPEKQLERRIEHDLEYIENWSLWRDIKILARTLFGGFRNRGALHS